MNKNPLLLSEVRKTIKKHNRSELEYIIAQMYKMISKYKKLDNDETLLIQNPAKYRGDIKKSKKKLRTFEEVKDELEIFIENAYEQNYFAPNLIIKKKDRPKWRFVVKRLFKELNEYAEQEKYLLLSANLQEKLYILLTYSCDYVLFNSYDSFESIGIEQKTFYKSILEKHNKGLEKKDFISKSIDLMFDNPLNRYTLYSNLMSIFLNFIDIPDLLYQTINIAKQKRKTLTGDKSDYEIERKNNNYTELIFRCYANLYEFDNALEDYRRHYISSPEEVKIYILVSLLMEYQKKELILNILKKADVLIPLRDSLKQLKDYIIKYNKLPEYI